MKNIKKLNSLPHDHIISVGSICNSNCLYCAAKKEDESSSLDENTGYKIIDFIVSKAPSYLYLEFTGGEPFLLTKKLDNILSYFDKRIKEKKLKKHISIVSNLEKLNDENIKFILKHRITICTSLDGPRELHNLQRNSTNDAYSKVSSAINKLKYYASKGIVEQPNIITTITKFSLPFYKEIINEYIKHSIMRVQLGTVEPIGKAKEIWHKIGITSQEYIKFYEKAFDEIIKINYDKKIPLYEKGFFLLFKSIKTKNFHPKRSIPVLNRLSYDHKGNIYPDDESRMLYGNKNNIFKIGDISLTPERFINSDKVNEILKYSITNNYDQNCAKCSYANYCYIPLWHRYIYSDTLSPSKTPKCSIFKFIFDLINQTQKDKIAKKITERWLEVYE